MIEDNPKNTSHPRIFLVSEKNLNKKLYNELMKKIKNYYNLKNIKKINNVFRYPTIGLKK